MLNNFEQLSEKSLESSLNSILAYIGKVTMEKHVIDSILSQYKMKTKIMAYESVLYNALTRTVDSIS